MNRHLKFIVAASPGHYQAAHRLLREEGVEKQVLGFPTVMAWDDDTLVGICGTRIVDRMILAGPLIVRTDRKRLFTIMRLCEAYESAMMEIGIRSFILSVENESLLHRGMNRYFPDQEPYAKDDEYSHYIWKVRGYGDQGKRSGTVAGGEGSSAQPG